MILTEEEAKKKWCPFARVIAGAIEHKGGTISPPYNRFAAVETGSHPNPVDARCIASECMAWRWNWEYQENSYTKEPPEPDGWGEWKKIGNFWARTLPQKTRGFCGLAGKAE